MPQKACPYDVSFQISTYLLPLPNRDHKRIKTGQILSCFNPFPKRQILDLSKLKEFADDSFRYEENGRKFSKRVGNTVGKGEIARYVFSTDLYDRHVKTRVCLGRG